MSWHATTAANARHKAWTRLGLNVRQQDDASLPSNRVAFEIELADAAPNMLAPSGTPLAVLQKICCTMSFREGQHDEPNLHDFPSQISKDEASWIGELAA